MKEEYNWHRINGDEMKRCCEKSENGQYRGSCPECGNPVFGNKRKVYCDKDCAATSAWKRQAVRRREAKREMAIHGAQ